MWRRLTYFFLALFLGLLLGPVAFSAQNQHIWRDKDMRRGYVETINPDQDEPGIAFIYIENPDADQRTLREKIFDERLTKEFTGRYQEKFGRTEAETFYTRSNVLEYLTVQGREYSQEQYYGEQKSFSTYMLRRTAEYHFETKGKEVAVTRAVIETKEKIQSVKVGIGKNIKLKAKYSIAANDIGVVVENPILDYRMTIPSNVGATSVSIGKGFRRIYYIESHYYSATGSFSLIGRRQLTALASVNITLTPNHWRRDEGVREQYGLAGLSWVF